MSINLFRLDKALNNPNPSSWKAWIKIYIMDYGMRLMVVSRYVFVLSHLCLSIVYRDIWTGFLKRPADEYNKQSLTLIRNIFLHGSWNEVFDLIEFVILSKFPVRENFIVRCNAVLKEENSAYKIVGELVTEITSQEEIESIETAMETPFAGANEHIGKALSLLSRRENPDYANSIKESISAVESIAKEITGKEKSLNALTQELNLPPALKTGLDALYNWTSQEGGIRHGASGESLNPDPKTARFMLIICSAFVHYIIAENPTTPPPSPKSGTRRT